MGEEIWSEEVEGVQEAYVFDLNGNKKGDVVLVTEDGVKVYLGGSSKISFDLSEEVKYVIYLAAGDLLGDERKEVAVCTGKTVWVLSLDGCITNMKEFDDIQSLHLRDMDGDGKEEIVVGVGIRDFFTYENRVYVFDVSREKSWSYGVDTVIRYWLDVGDKLIGITGKKSAYYLDLKSLDSGLKKITLNESSRVIGAITLGDRICTLTEIGHLNAYLDELKNPLTHYLNSSIYECSMDKGDFDRDGEDELVFVLWDGKASEARLLDLEGETWNETKLGDSVIDAKFADLDGDGAKELVLLDDASVRAINQTKEVWGSKADGAKGLCIGDLNGDGKEDVLLWGSDGIVGLNAGLSPPEKPPEVPPKKKDEEGKAGEGVKGKWYIWLIVGVIVVAILIIVLLIGTRRRRRELEELEAGEVLDLDVEDSGPGEDMGSKDSGPGEDMGSKDSGPGEGGPL
jgi:hypothetical protein